MLKTIIKFSATWCQPCKVFAPTFHRVMEMEEYKNITFKEFDVEKDEEAELLAEKYQIRSVPTTVLLDENDGIIYKLMGNVPQKDFIEVINKALKDR